MPNEAARATIAAVNGPVARLLLALLVSASWGSAAAAQPPNIEMLSKDDALKIFAMSRQQWERNVTALVAAGAAERTYPSPLGLVGMVMNTPEGTVITRLDYSQGDARPAFAQMAFTVGPSWSARLTEASALETIADIQQQLAPEFDVDGRVDRLSGGPAFFFIIRERAGARRPVETSEQPAPAAATRGR